jgi:hypothetical protein
MEVIDDKEEKIRSWTKLSYHIQNQIFSKKKDQRDWDGKICLQEIFEYKRWPLGST